MPELPEVEITCRGIAPAVINNTLNNVIVRQQRLRWPISDELLHFSKPDVIQAVHRRGKYILLTMAKGTIIIHLGMSGSLRVLPQQIKPGKHDHVDLLLMDNTLIRFHDPRRFGAVLWCNNDVLTHSLLVRLGIEPLSRQFNANYLYQKATNRQIPVKNFIMDHHVVVGIGNIYAQESLFLAKILPTKAACQVSQDDYQQLVTAIKQVLRRAIQLGGTTLRDFSKTDGKPGYFQQTLNVYGRGDLPCQLCGQILSMIRIGQRSTVYCKQCQH